MSDKPTTEISKTFQAYDAEKDKFVEITPEQRQNALHLQRQLEMSTLMQALALKQIFDTRAYLALNFTSKIEYIENALPFQKRQAYRLLSIADAFQKTYPELAKVPPGARLPALESGENVTPGLQAESDWMELGVSKLYEISRLDDEMLQESLKSGKLKTKTGRELTIDDLKDMSKKAVSDEIKKIRGKYAEKVSVQEEDIRALKAELKAAQKKAAETMAKLGLYEDKFRAEAVRLDEKEAALEEAYQYQIKFYKALTAANINDDDPDALLIKLKVIMQNHQDNWRSHLYHRYSFALDMLESIN